VKPAPPLLGVAPDEERDDPLRPIVEQVLLLLRQLHAGRGRDPSRVLWKLKMA
jgi:hypothetical protein